MAEISIAADCPRLVPGVLVTGWALARVGHVPRHWVPLGADTPLGRIYRGFGRLRAETGQPPRRGFGSLIGGAQISDAEMTKGLRLWLKIRD